MPYQGYKSSIPATSTPRTLEYEAFAHVTYKLKTANSTPTTVEEEIRLQTALHENLRLWDVLVLDVAASENALPDPLKAGLVYLARATHEHSRRIRNRSGDLQILLDINASVMKGLRQHQEIKESEAA